MSTRGVSYTSALAVAALLGGITVVVLLRLSLPPLRTIAFFSGYGVVDHRRLLIAYTAFLLIVLAAPFLTAALLRRRGGGERTTPAGKEGEPGISTPEPGPRGRRWGAALVLLPILAVLFLGPWIAYGPLDGHELVHLGYLNEISHGRVLNLDTRITYGPLLGYAIYGFMRLVGFNLVGFRLFWNVTTIAFLLLLFLLARPRFRSRTLFVLFFLCALSGTTAAYYLAQGEGIRWGWANPWRHGWAPLALLALSGPVLRSPRAWPRIAAGALPVLGGFFAQETLVPGAVTLGALVLFGWRTSSSRSLLRDASLFLAGAAIGLAIAVAPALLRGAPAEYVRITWRIPGLFLRGAGATEYPLPFRDSWTGAGDLVYVLVPGALLALLLYAWLGTLRGKGVVTTLVGLYGVLSYATVLVRGDAYHISNVALAPLLFGFLVLDAWWRARSRERLAPAFAGVLLLSVIWIPPGFGGLGRAVLAHITDPWPGPPRGWERIPGPRGGIWTPPRQWVRFTGGRQPFAVDTPVMIRQLAGGNETVVNDTNGSLYYFLADVPAAVPFTDLSSQCLSADDRALLVNRFSELEPPIIFQSMTVSIQYPDRYPGEYQPVLEYGGFVGIMLRGSMGPVAQAVREGTSPIEEPWRTALYAGILASQGNPEGAVRILRASTKHPGAHPVLTRQLGRILQDAGRPAQAAEAFRAALAVDPYEFFAYYRLVGAEAAAGDSAAAEADLVEATRVFPGNHILLERLASLREAGGDAEGAVSAWQAALDAEPKSPTAAYHLGRMLVQLGHAESALPVLEDLVERYPEDPEVWTAVGVARYRTGLTEEAKEAFREALRLEPDAREPYLGLIKIHLAAGDTAGAVALMHQRQALHPGTSPGGTEETPQEAPGETGP